MSDTAIDLNRSRRSLIRNLHFRLRFTTNIYPSPPRVNFDQLREPERVKSWVFRIARNNCLMKRRKSLFAPSEEISMDAMVDDGSGTGTRPRVEPVDSAEKPDMRAFRGEMRDALEAAIRRLPPNHRAVVLLRDIEELSTEETAEILDLSVDVVKARLHRARLALREDLAPHLAAVEQGR